MLKRSAYAHRYLYAVISALALILSSVFILLDTLVWVHVSGPILTGTITFTPVPSNPTVTPVQTVYTDTDYVDEHIQIHITTVTKTNPNLVYYVADIKMDSAQYWKNSFAQKGTEKVSSQATRHNAILAINSDDCYISSQKLTIRNGTLYNDNFRDEIIALMPDGALKIYKGVSGKDLVSQGVVNSYSFGPALVVDGQYAQRSSSVAVANPRTGIGMIAPLHYIFIIVDGRWTKPTDHSVGLKMSDFAQLFVDAGCQIAYNLDGGGSSELYFHNKVINLPYDGTVPPGTERPVTDIIYIGEQ